VIYFNVVITSSGTMTLLMGYIYRRIRLDLKVGQIFTAMFQIQIVG